MRQPSASARGMRVLAAALLATVTVSLAPSTQSQAAEDDPALTDSAVTKSGTGRFADLEVTVGKTARLTNEAVRVSWQWRDSDPGSHATRSDTSWNYNYVQVFQCWGDDPTGPDREQCQFGGQFSEQDAGTNRRLGPFNTDPDKAWALSRAVSPIDAFGRAIAESTDPLEYAEDGPIPGYPVVDGRPGIVPMRAAPSAEFPDGETLTRVDTGAFFDLYGTNEVPLARTNGDGSGQVYFEVQTVYESRFLGCGARLRGGAAGSGDARDCWLVVVPRDSTDSNGEDVTTRASGSDRALFSSPLSLSNWENRITFPLDFEPVREPCALGGVERPVVGHESLSVAMSSWQGPLCSSGQGFFYATTTDDIARESAASANPKYSVVTEPLPADAVPAEKGALVYAPLALSGVSVSFFLERYYASNVAPEYRVNNGTRVEEIRLTPRLVAKLLTQSYRYSTVTVGGGPEHLADAPLSLIDDPEFKAVNTFTTADGAPDLSRDLLRLSNQRESLAKIFVTPDSSDAVRLVWQWILGDKEARAFLAGEPDEYGMTVNPYFKGIETYVDLDVPRADIPRLDGVCIDVAVGYGGGETRPVCPLDAAPYVGSFDSGAALTARGQTLGSQSWVKDFATGFVKPEKPSPQLVGQRALIALTDTPSSQRRGLVAAALRNADGTFVPPTATAMTAALAQAVDTEIPGVVRVESDAVEGAGYPLTRVSYGVTNPALLGQEARDDYADFATFVATDGQVAGTRPGQLPIGYAPLPWPLRTQTLDAAKAIRSATAPARVSKPTPAPGQNRPTTTLATSKPALAAATEAPAAAAPATSSDAAEAEPTAPTASGKQPDSSADGLPSPADVTPAPKPSAASKPAADLGPTQIQRISALTPATTLGPLRWVLPALVALGLLAALAGRVLARRGERDTG